jgi:hypothetical protein
MLAVENSREYAGQSRLNADRAGAPVHTNDNDANELELLDRLNDRLNVGWLLAVRAQARPAVVGLRIVCDAQLAPPDQVPI